MALRDLERYRTFHRGWDGYDGEVFQDDVVDRARMVVSALSQSFLIAQTEPMEISPCPISDGRIDVEAACRGRRLIITLESASDEVGVFFDDHGAPHEELARWNTDNVGRWVRRLTGEDNMSALFRHPQRDPLDRETVAVRL